MSKRMLIDALHSQETRVVVEQEGRVLDCDFSTESKRQIKGNIYLAKITRVEPSLQAAFVEYGGGKQGFLPFSEIHPSYYQIPLQDRLKLMEEMNAEDDGDDHDAADDVSMMDVQVGPEDAAFVSETPAIAMEREDETLRSVVAAWDVPMPNAAPDAEESHAPIAPVHAHVAEVVADEQDSEWQPETIENGEVMSDAAPEAEASALRESFEETIPMHHEANGDHASQDAEKPAASEDEEEERRPRRRSIHRRYRIQEVIKRGQIILVQVIKEERGNKGVSLSSYVSLAGRYCVLMPNSTKGGGISRKIANNEHRRRLREMLDEISPERSTGMSVIIRTAGIDRSRVEIRRDYEYLVKLWNQIREQTLSSQAPAMIYEEGDLIKRSIRDMYTSDIEDVYVAGDEGYREAKDFMKLLMPSHAVRVHHYKESVPLFFRYGVEEQLANMYDPSARLRSGGYLVINPTEALIAIDVNSGRSTGERNIEETAKKTNLEAAEEIARQLRLRDLAGLIVIDFIDMLESRNRRAVEKALKDALRADRAKIQIGRISPFGLLEMSRQRLRPSIAESIHVSCSHCQGRGHLRSFNTVSLQIIRTLEREASLGTATELRVLTSNDVALHFLNHFRSSVTELEARHQVQINITISDKALPDGFTLERAGVIDKEAIESLKRPQRPQRQPSAPRVSQEPREDGEGGPQEVLSEGRNEGRGEGRGEARGERRPRRGRRGGRNRGDAENTNDAPVKIDAVELSDDVQDAGDADNDVEIVVGEDGQKTERRRRRSRGGRRRRFRDDRRKGREGEVGEAGVGEACDAVAATGQQSDESRVARSADAKSNGGWRGRRSYAPAASEAPLPAGVIASYAPSNPAPSTPEYRATVQPMASFAPSASAPKPVPQPVISVTPSAPAEAEKPKRFGWWRKVMDQ